MLKKVFFIALFLCPILLLEAQTPSNLEDFFKEKNITPQKTERGVYYTLDKKGSGRQPMRGDYVQVNYKGSLLDGKVFDQSNNEPLVFQMGHGQVIEGWEKGMEAFPVGTKGTMYIPSNLAYGSQGNGEIPADAPVIFDIEILKILSAKEYDAYMVALEQKEQAAFEANKKAQFEKDKRLINDYALSHKLKVKRTDSGLSYIVTKVGKGENAKAGDVLQVNYDGFLVDDKPFDSTKGKKPFEFLLGYGRTMDGWEEGLTFFNKGSEGYLLIPSKLGYGLSDIDKGEVHIPSNAVLIFKIQVVEVQKGK